MERVKTDEELKEMAKDLHAGRIFTDRHLPEGEKASLVFMVLALMDSKQLDEFKKNVDEEKIFMVYEYMEKAGPRTINGMPMFMSFQSLNKPDTEKMLEYFHKIEDAMKAL